jgi:hypothetical protein
MCKHICAGNPSDVAKRQRLGPLTSSSPSSSSSTASAAFAVSAVSAAAAAAVAPASPAAAASAAPASLALAASSALGLPFVGESARPSACSGAIGSAQPPRVARVCGGITERAVPPLAIDTGRANGYQPGAPPLATASQWRSK